MARASKRASVGRRGYFTPQSVVSATETLLRSGRRLAPVINAVNRGIRSLNSGSRRTYTSSSRASSRMRGSRSSQSVRRRLNFGNPYRYVTYGRKGVDFVKARKSKVNKFLRDGVVIKREGRQIVNDVNCVYVGHYALPLNLVFKSCCMSLARQVMRSHGQYMSDFRAESEEAAMNCLINFRTTLDGPITTSVPINTAARPTIEELGAAIGQNIINALAGNRYFEVVNVIVKTNTSAEQIFNVPGNQIWFTIMGNSNLQVQNRTAAGTGVPTGDQTNMLDIENNPLRGKVYQGFGNIHPYRFNNDGVGTKSMRFENADGLLFLGSNDAALSTEMGTALKKPPPRQSFGGVVKSNYVSLAPGEIKRSNVKTTMKVNLNQFIKIFQDNLDGAVNVDSLSTTGFVNKGRGVFYGLEKLLDAGGETQNPISVGIEVTATVSTVCNANKRVYCQPLILT